MAALQQRQRLTAATKEHAVDDSRRALQSRNTGAGHDVKESVER
jgi:hypothetical protein